MPLLSHKHGQSVEKHLVLLWLAKSLSPGPCSGSSLPALGGTLSSFTSAALAPSPLCCPLTSPGGMSTASGAAMGPLWVSRWRINGKRSPEADSFICFTFHYQAAHFQGVHCRTPLVSTANIDALCLSPAGEPQTTTASKHPKHERLLNKMTQTLPCAVPQAVHAGCCPQERAGTQLALTQRRKSVFCGEQGAFPTLPAEGNLRNRPPNFKETLNVSDLCFVS